MLLAVPPLYACHNSCWKKRFSHGLTLCFTGGRPVTKLQRFEVLLKRLQAFPSASLSMKVTTVSDIDKNNTTTSMVRTFELTVIQQTTNVQLHEQRRAGSLQCAVSNIHGKLTGKEKCGRKRHTGNMDELCLKKIYKQSWIVNLHKVSHREE